MHRASSAFNLAITPMGHQHFAAWLLRGSNRSNIVRNILPASSVKLYNSAAAEPFLNGATSSYVEDMYNAWLRNPASVHASWDAFFKNNAYAPPPNHAPVERNTVPLSALTSADGRPDAKMIDDHLAVQAIIRSYQSRGHLASDLDPLGILNQEISVSQDGVKRRANENVLRQHNWFMTGNFLKSILVSKM